MGEGKGKPETEQGKGGPSQSPPLLIVVSGPSGVGKDAVLARLKTLEPRLRQVVTVTTRPPRRGEVDGRDYHFVSTQKFEQMLHSEQLLEHACVYGYWYGVPKDQVTDSLRQGYDVLLRTDVQGAATIKRLAPEGVFIFVAPASMDELQTRLQRRGGSSDSDQKTRLEKAREEMAAQNMFDYVVVNREGAMGETVSRIQAILGTERQRKPPRRVDLS